MRKKDALLMSSDSKSLLDKGNDKSDRARERQTNRDRQIETEIDLYRKTQMDREIEIATVDNLSP